MKISIPVTVDVYFDIDAENQSEINVNNLCKQIRTIVSQSIDTDTLCDNIQDEIDLDLASVDVSILE
jgi:hypothetical protein